MITAYLNQNVEWKKYTGTNGYGEPIYGEVNTIKARYRRKNILVKNKEGQEIVSNSQVLTVESVEIGDLIDGREVIDVQFTPDINGENVFRKVML